MPLPWNISLHDSLDHTNYQRQISDFNVCSNDLTVNLASIWHVSLYMNEFHHHHHLLNVSHRVLMEGYSVTPDQKLQKPVTVNKTNKYCLHQLTRLAASTVHSWRADTSSYIVSLHPLLPPIPPLAPIPPSARKIECRDKNSNTVLTASNEFCIHLWADGFIQAQSLFFSPPSLTLVCLKSF